MVDRYTYRLVWSPKYQKYAARCLELATLASLGTTQLEALNQIAQLVTEVIDGIGAPTDQPLPDPAFESAPSSITADKLVERQAWRVASTSPSESLPIIRFEHRPVADDQRGVAAQEHWPYASCRGAPNASRSLRGVDAEEFATRYPTLYLVSPCITQLCCWSARAEISALRRTGLGCLGVCGSSA